MDGGSAGNAGAVFRPKKVFFSTPDSGMKPSRNIVQTLNALS